MRHLIVFSLSIFSIFSTQAQIFTGVDINLPQLEYSSIVIGDINEDGKVDFALSGKGLSVTEIYLNQGSFSFMKDTINTFIPSAEFGDLELVDIDLDGDLDLMMDGRRPSDPATPIPSLYLNDGRGKFIIYPVVNILAGDFMDFDFGDFDNDGDLDLMTNSNWYLNNGDLTFDIIGYHSSNSNGIEAITSGSVDWGDVDNDGDLDLLVTGNNGWSSYASCNIYFNHNGTFLVDSINNFPDVAHSDAKWGDFDSDGDLDFAVAGGGDDGPILEIYQNDNLTFEKVEILNSGGLSGAAMQWGDINNDGLLDLMVSGSKGAADIFAIHVLENNGNGSFNQILELPGCTRGDLELVDFDGDQDLDIIVTGGGERDKYGNIIGHTRIYRNNTTEIKEIPSIPFALKSTILSDSVILNWSVDETEKTQKRGLQFDVTVWRGIGKLVKGTSIYDPSTQALDTALILRNLGDGYHYWKVRSINNSFVKSSFSVVDSFYVGKEKPILDHYPKNNLLPKSAGEFILNLKNIGKGNISWQLIDKPEWISLSQSSGGNYESITANFDENTGVRRNGKIIISYGETNQQYTINLKQEGERIFMEYFDHGIDNMSTGSTSWGDVNNDGYYDLLISGYNRGNHRSKLYVNDSLSFEEVAVPNLTNLNFGGSTMMDSNNDQLVDFVISGQDVDRSNELSLFKNLGSNLFQKAETTFPGISFSSITASDFNNDGYNDLIFSGYTGYVGDPTSQLYFNQGNDLFLQDSLFINNKKSISNITSCDYDGDGDNDIFISNLGLFNNENGHFIRDSTQSFPVGNGCSFVDINNDGHKDIFVDGYIYSNGGTNSFELIENDGIANSIREHSWGDYDSDGDLDLVGLYSFPSSVVLYENLGDFKFALVQTETLGKIGTTSVASIDFIDINRDHKLDIFYITGCCREERSRIFQNQYDRENTKPGPPVILQDSLNLKTAYFFWNNGNDSETTSDVLGYNLQVEDIAGNVIFNALSNDTVSLIPNFGSLSTNYWKLHFKEPGLYSWKVQSVDQGHCVSKFSSEHQIELISQLYFTSDSLEVQAGRKITFEWEEAFVDQVRLTIEVGEKLVEIAILEGQSAYTWEVPFSYREGRYLVIINDVNSLLSDSLNLVIYPGLEITYPDSASGSQINRDLIINWKSGDIENVSLEYSKSSGIEWTTIQDNVPNENQFVWSVPIVEPDYYFVRISDENSPSKDSLLIELNPYLELINPKSDSTFHVNRPVLIDWESYHTNTIQVSYQVLGSSSWELLAQTDSDNFVWLPEENVSEDSVRFELLDLASAQKDTSEFVYINSVILSIEEFSDGITIYPNPLSDQLRIQGLDENSIRLITLATLNGIMYKFKSLSDLNSHVGHVKEGIYILQITTNENEVIRQKVLKTKASNR